MEHKIDIDKIISLAEKSITETLVNSKGEPIWLIGGKDNPLRDTCIPTCFSILPELRKKHPNAKVIIGCYGDWEGEIHEAQLAIIRRFEENIDRLNRVVHAWINLDSKSDTPKIFDITTPRSCRHNNRGIKVFDNEVINNGITDTKIESNGCVVETFIQPTYVSLFEDESDTLNIYAHLIRERLRVDSLYEVKRMHELVSKQLSLPYNITSRPQKISLLERIKYKSRRFSL